MKELREYIADYMSEAERQKSAALARGDVMIVTEIRGAITALKDILTEADRFLADTGSLLLVAETVLADLDGQMGAEYKEAGATWTRDWMQKHVRDRATLINTRKILMDRFEAMTSLPNTDSTTQKL